LKSNKTSEVSDGVKVGDEPSTAAERPGLDIMAERQQ
jgi:hypothetical protein